MKAIKAVASLRLTVLLLALSIFLVFAGTLAQTTEGIWTVVDRYFRSLYVLIPLQIFVPGSIARVPGVIPFPGGLTLGVALFVNLIAAHAVRFKFSWRRSGMIVAHLGVLLLLVGEFVTGALATEGDMRIDEGSFANYVEDVRTAELAIVDPSDPESDLVVVVPQRLLSRAGVTVADPLLPFDVRVDAWMPNSRVLGPMEASRAQRALATAGIGLTVAAQEVPRARGVDGATVDVPAAYITLLRDGANLGTYLITPHLSEQQVDVNGKRYQMALRFKRTYKPYTLHLIDFRHDKFVGTEMPKNFSSLVRLVDPSKHVDREALIYMNHPLRYSGETFYQSAFKPDNTGTVLQVVKNPGWLIPYVSCAMVTAGLIVHFGVRLGTSVRRRIS